MLVVLTNELVKRSHSLISRQPDRQTDILFDVYVYIVTQNGLQYNAHDSGYSNKHDK